MKMIKRKKSKKKSSGAHVVFHRLLKTSECCSVQAVLLCKRTEDAPIHPGYWGFFGGKLKRNESPKNAVRREVNEELEANGIDFRKFAMKNLCYVTIRRGSGKDSISYFYASLDIDMDELRLKRQGKVEGEGLAWFTAEEIHHLMMRPEDRIAINKFFQKNGI